MDLNENIEYEYSTNLSDANVTWKVLRGDIEIVAGVDSKKVIIRLGENFEEGIIQADGISNDGDLLECGDTVLITKK